MNENQNQPTEETQPIDPKLLSTTTAKVVDFLTTEQFSVGNLEETQAINTWVYQGYSTARLIENHHQTRSGMRKQFRRLPAEKQDDPQYEDLKKNYLKLGLFGFEGRMLEAFNQLPKESKDAIASAIIWLDTAGIEEKYRQKFLTYILNATGDNRKLLRQFPNEFKHFFDKSKESKANFVKLYSFVVGYLQFHRE